MNLKEMYFYVFYKIYKVMEFFKLNGGANKFRAIIFMTLLETWLVFALYNYWKVFFGHHNTTIPLISFKIIPFILIFILKWLAFIKDDKWKNYVQRFDDFSHSKNLKGTYLVTGVAIFIFCNLILSGYL